MTRLLSCAALVLLLLPGLGAQKEVRRFIRQHNNGPENVSFTVPGWLIGLSAEIGLIAAGDDDEARAVFALAQELGTTRVLSFEDENERTRRDIRELLGDLEREHGYERWATVRTVAGESIDLTVQQRGKVLRHVVGVVRVPEERRVYFLHARTDLSPAALGDFINDLALE